MPQFSGSVQRLIESMGLGRHQADEQHQYHFNVSSHSRETSLFIITFMWVRLSRAPSSTSSVSLKVGQQF